MPHVIRLRGPWDAEYSSEGQKPASQEPELRQTKRITLPVDAGADLSDLQGRMKFLRRFGCPSGLGSDERVWLVLERTRGRILLNNERLGDIAQDETARFDVTARLADRNVLAIEAEIAPAVVGGDETQSARPPFPIGDVRLEIVAGE